MSEKQLNKETIEARNVSIDVVRNMTKDELCYIAEKNPCVRGMLDGYIYEFHLEKLLKSTNGVTNVFKPDDHDRKRNKSDFIVTYKGREIRIQSKSLQTNSIKFKGDKYSATVQNDSSDKHTVTLPNGKRINVTNYTYNGYDILAVCIVNFTKNMDFAFKLNSECSCTTNKKIPYEDRKYLMNTSEKITYPLEETWTSDITEILDRVPLEQKNFKEPGTIEQMIMDL